MVKIMKYYKNRGSIFYLIPSGGMKRCDVVQGFLKGYNIDLRAIGKDIQDLIRLGVKESSHQKSVWATFCHGFEKFHGTRNDLLAGTIVIP